MGDQPEGLLVNSERLFKLSVPHGGYQLPFGLESIVIMVIIIIILIIIIIITIMITCPTPLYQICSRS